MSDGKRKMKWSTGPPPMDPQKLYINPGQEDQMEIQGYRKSLLWSRLIWVCTLLTVGILQLFFYWFPNLKIRATHQKSALANADSVLLRDQYLQWFVATVHTCTKDGTRVKVVVESAPTCSFLNNKRRKRPNLLLATPQTDENLIRYFMVKKVKYIWDQRINEFVKLRGLDDIDCSFFHETTGLGLIERGRKRVLYGVNCIDVHVSPIFVLFYKEILTPFYVFQVFSITVWVTDEYFYYASCIFLISTISIIITIYQTRKNQRALRNTIQTSTVVSVCRENEEFEDVSSEDLVPGDVIEIPHTGCILQCDAVLISGNCIVNESMLTGESVPITKTPLTNTWNGNSEPMFSIKEHARHVLFCGTRVIQTRYYGSKKVKAVVIRTGFYTAKGELVRSILYPKPVDFKFNRDTYFFVGVLGLIAGVGLVYTLILMVGRGSRVFNIIKRSLDLITIAVPPALPAALSVGIVFAQRRLRTSEIYCISPRSINICGSINAVCFDKTGTLTEDGLNMQGVVPVKDKRFEEAVTNMVLLKQGPVMEALATCHSLTIIDGKLCGDPLDLIMFQFLDWTLDEGRVEESNRFDMICPTVVRPKTALETMHAEELSTMHEVGEEIGIVRQFTFSSSLQRMSVITRRIGADNFIVYAKGSPEMITSLCKPDTVPDDFHQVLSSYTQHGYRVIGLAYKQLPANLKYVKVQRMQREQVENDLIFLGLLVMENKLKPETTPIIHKLKEANIRTIMITGDNMLTALSVARECTMVEASDIVIHVQAYFPSDSQTPRLEFTYDEDCERQVEEVFIDRETTVIEIDGKKKFHFAVTGKCWAVLRQHFPDVLSKIAVRGTIFARMSPDQKAQLVEALQELGYYVGMCGDGANDCGALKTAHTGISLSEAEASVASPFTSKNANIECVPTVIREGRAALVTSFGIFKYMACYSLNQFVSVLICYSFGANLTDLEFLYIDLFLLTTLSVTFGRTKAYPSLAKDPPPLSLTSPAPILSLILQMGIQIAAQVFCFQNIKQQPWFVPHEPNEDEIYVSYENTAVFSISAFQYIILAIAFSKGAPYRRSIFSNYIFLLNIAVCLAVTLLIIIYPFEFIIEFLELKPAPILWYRLLFVGIAVINGIASILLETFLLDHIVIRKVFQAWHQRCCPATKYEYNTIEAEMALTPSWPPLSPSSNAIANGTAFPENSSPGADAKDTDRILRDFSDSSSITSTPSRGCSRKTSQSYEGEPNLSRSSVHFSHHILQDDSPTDKDDSCEVVIELNKCHYENELSDISEASKHNSLHEIFSVGAADSVADSTPTSKHKGDDAVAGDGEMDTASIDSTSSLLGIDEKGDS
ncbi:hypothetical protein CHS0354_018848 [Potamilus streckersoni]|uniref:Cation-transporting ATPase n=1 Tax=Potamilus streckersoni TaxID=2493646 RepID=A0AAE0SIF9_9BIVA|nr:hypothetical protein CHS0354_018848 [Potamilus streckersoni]